MKLKDLKKKQGKSSSGVCVLRAGIVVLIDDQDEFNELSELIGLTKDSIITEGSYCCSLDHQGIPEFYPLTSICVDIENVLEHLKHKNLIPIDFCKWVKKFR